MTIDDLDDLERLDVGDLNQMNIDDLERLTQAMQRLAGVLTDALTPTFEIVNKAARDMAAVITRAWMITSPVLAQGFYVKRRNFPGSRDDYARFLGLTPRDYRHFERLRHRRYQLR